MNNNYVLFHVNDNGDYIFAGEFKKIKKAYNYCWAILNDKPCESFLIYTFVDGRVQESDYCEFSKFGGKKKINHIHKYIYHAYGVIK